jgi:hypothetical protein
VVHPRQSYEAWGVMESILSHGIEYVTESRQDEDWEQRWTDASDEVYEASWKEVWS